MSTPDNEKAIAAPDTLAFTLDEARGEETRGTATGQDIRDALTGEPRLQKIKVVHQGGVFSLPGDETTKKFTAIIVAHTQRNARFDKPYGEGGDDDNFPICYSYDGTNIADEVGEREGTERQAAACTSCKLNRNARDREAREHAFKELTRKETCNNYLSMVVQIFDADGTLVDIGYRLDASNSSFRNWNDFAQGIGSRGGYKPREVITEFTLVKDKTADGVEYSRIEFAKVGVVPVNARPAIEKRHAVYLGILRREGFTQQESTPDARDAAKAARAAADKAAASGDAGL